MPRPQTKQAAILLEALHRRTVEQRALADALGVTDTSISKWLRADRADTIPPHHWRTICQLLQIPWQSWVEAAEERQVHRYKQIYGSLARH